MNGHELLAALRQFSSEDLDLPVCSRQGDSGDARELGGIWVAHDSYTGDMLLVDGYEPEDNHYNAIQPGREPIIVEADVEPAAPGQVTFIRYESWDDPYIAAGIPSGSNLPEQITQCHCGCARSKHVNRNGDCTLCGHCPRYRVRTGPVF